MPIACVSDWDGTLRPGFIADDWLLFLSKELGVGRTHYSEFKAALQAYRLGTLAYEQFALDAADIYARALTGFREVEVVEAGKRFAEEDKAKLFDFTLPLLGRIKREGYSIFLLSGGPRIPLSSYMAHLPVDGVFATDIFVQDGFFVEHVACNYALAKNKKRAVNSLLSQGFDISLGFGDTASDEPLLNAAEHAFVVTDHEDETVSKRYRIVKPQSIISEVEKVVFRGRTQWTH